MQMKHLLVLAVSTAALVALAASCAQNSSESTPISTPSPSTTAAPAENAPAVDAALKEAGNKSCPITGEPVGSMEKGAHVDHAGYRVGLCCSGCDKQFNTAADDYLKKALNEGKEPAA